MTGIAYAQASGAAGSGSSLLSLVPIALMIVIFYFLLIRPQQKKEKERKGMIDALKQGDKVLTAGGIYGTVDSFKDQDIVVLKISGNTKVEFTKSSIQAKVS
ncbi:MAG TPA: preprotein translocase subunit YajC [Spirochaetota bacterium]|nr:preprotein translocase subunit YajC [Spirochaetota bacterium]HPI88148.1 preprotein translocase subunit YajC [Spirochaetota bacterium]HPR47923.1 preprotein translocase subunit YajC [Spirochaetota bacterium]